MEDNVRNKSCLRLLQRSRSFGQSNQRMDCRMITALCLKLAHALHHRCIWLTGYVTWLPANVFSKEEETIQIDTMDIKSNASSSDEPLRGIVIPSESPKMKKVSIEGFFFE